MKYEKFLLTGSIILNAILYLDVLWVWLNIYFGVYARYTISGVASLGVGVLVFSIFLLGVLSAVRFAVVRIGGQKAAKNLIGALVINWLSIILLAAFLSNYGGA